MSVYVGNLLIASNEIHLLTIEKRKLSERFDMKDQGEVQYRLAMSIKQNRNKVCSQSTKEHLLHAS